MIDYLLNFPDETVAKSDTVVGAFYVSGKDMQGATAGAWRGDVCIPAVQVWDTRQDVAGTDVFDGATLTHTYAPGFWMIIALPERNAALDAHAATMLVADRDAANAGASTSVFVKQTPILAADLPFKRLQPTFAGSSYPFGAQ